MDIRVSDVTSYYYEYRIRAFSNARPYHPQVPNRPLGENGFGLGDTDIWNMTRQIMIQVQARLHAPLMNTDVANSYPPDSILSGDLPNYDSDTMGRIFKALKAVPGYTLVQA